MGLNVKNLNFIVTKSVFQYVFRENYEMCMQEQKYETSLKPGWNEVVGLRQKISFFIMWSCFISN